MTTITAIDFYRMLNDALGLEETKKVTDVLTNTGETQKTDIRKQNGVIIVIDEAQF